MWFLVFANTPQSYIVAMTNFQEYRLTPCCPDVWLNVQPNRRGALMVMEKMICDSRMTNSGHAIIFFCSLGKEAVDLHLIVPPKQIQI